MNAVSDHKNECLLLSQFIQNIGSNILNQNQDAKYVAVKFLILASSLVLELRRTVERVIEYGNKGRTSLGCAFPGVVDDCSFIHEISGKLVDKLLYLLVWAFFCHGLLVWYSINPFSEP